VATRKCFFLLFTALLMLTLSACHKHYWQRNKIRIRQQQKKPSIEVRIRNKTPYIFNLTFTDELKTVCEQEFERMGYTIAQTDSPDYIAFIRVDMDSFPVTGVYVFGMGGPSSFWRPYRKEKVYAILFDYRIVNNRSTTVKWEERNDIYYFDNAERNSRRSKNMVKYTIRYGK
jgi:hypothetical protein